MLWQVPETKKRKRKRNSSQALACRLSFYVIGHQSIDYTKGPSLKQEQFFLFPFNCALLYQKNPDQQAI
jgi:hypothetical protein